MRTRGEIGTKDYVCFFGKHASGLERGDAGVDLRSHFLGESIEVCFVLWWL